MADILKAHVLLRSSRYAGPGNRPRTLSQKTFYVNTTITAGDCIEADQMDFAKLVSVDTAVNNTDNPPTTPLPCVVYTNDLGVDELMFQHNADGAFITVTGSPLGPQN